MTEAERIAHLFRADDGPYQGYTAPEAVPAVIDVPDDVDPATLPHPVWDAPGGCTLPHKEQLTLRPRCTCVH